VKPENKALLIKYIVCFCVASAITAAIIVLKYSLNNNPSEKISVLSVLSDGFTVSGVLMILFAGMMFVSGEGALIGIGFVLRNIVLAFVPAGRMRHEKYADYRERKMAEAKKTSDHSILVTGLVFLAIGIVFIFIWYSNLPSGSAL
jgi:hypothetical protein